MTAQITIDLGKDLGYLAGSITDVYVTNDYMGRLVEQYHEHVDNFYEEDPVNDFAIIYRFKRFMEVGPYKYAPYEDPLDDLDDFMPLMKQIMENRSAYRSTFNIMKKYASRCKNAQVRTMVVNVLDSLFHCKRNFKAVAETMDRHLGHYFKVSDLVNAVVAFGELSGLVDYYSFQEVK